MASGMGPLPCGVTEMSRLTNDQVADLFAAGLAPAATNSNGSLWFANRVIYSYGTHFPVAVWAEDLPNTVYFTRDTYSTTTAQHKASVFRALKRAGVDVVPVTGIRDYAAQARAVSHRPVTHRRDIFAA